MKRTNAFKKEVRSLKKELSTLKDFVHSNLPKCKAADNGGKSEVKPSKNKTQSDSRLQHVAAPMPVAQVAGSPSSPGKSRLQLGHGHGNHVCG